MTWPPAADPSLQLLTLLLDKAQLQFHHQLQQEGGGKRDLGQGPRQHQHKAQLQSHHQPQQEGGERRDPGNGHRQHLHHPPEWKLLDGRGLPIKQESRKISTGKGKALTKPSLSFCRGEDKPRTNCVRNENDWQLENGGGDLQAE